MAEMKPVILVIDDSTHYIDVLVDTLAGDYKIQVAVTGKKALSLAKNSPPDLILVDVMMPDINGFEICKRLQLNDKTSSIPIVFLTSASSAEEEAKGLSLGAVDFISKPFTPALVRARLRNHMELKHHRDKLEILVNERTEELNHTKEATISCMAHLAEYRDPETGFHIQRTKEYVRLLAFQSNIIKKYSLGYTVIESYSLSATLHDIGKVGIPDSILLKPGSLTPEEWVEMKKHTTYGAQVIRQTETHLGSNSFLRSAREICECHHEKWDGTGYPNGLKGEEIPYSARLMALADVYDALRSVRTYKAAFTHKEAVDIITNGDNRTKPEHFDPEVLIAFGLCEKEFERVENLLRD